MKKKHDEEELEFNFNLDDIEPERPRKKRAKSLHVEKQEKIRKKKRKPEMEVQGETLGEPITEDFLLPDMAPEAEAPLTFSLESMPTTDDIEDDSLAMTQSTGPESVPMKRMQVTLEFPAITDPNHSFGLIMECIEDHLPQKIKDRDIDAHVTAINHLGNVPLHTLMVDRDRFWEYLYAACYVRIHPGSDAVLRNETPKTGAINPQHDAFAENVAQEGRHWGLRMEKDDLPRTGISPEERQKARDMPQSVDPIGANFVDDGTLPNPFSKGTAELLEATKLAPKEKPPEGTIAAQVMQKEGENLEAFKAAQSTEGDYVAERAQAKAVYNTKFAEAERLAKLPREAWANAPYELVKMIEFAQRWYKDTGTVPGYGENLIELYWESPQVNLSPEATSRRDKLIQTLRNFWQSSVTGATPESGFNVFSQSYRTTLAAMELEKLIERYASGEDIEAQIRAAAIRYFHAHFPVDRLGAKPGPISTLDPNYHEYVKLCQKYNLVLGTLLHEADL